MSNEIIGNCVICGREMIKDVYINRHHLIPKAKNGKHTEQITIHTVCHNKIHSIWPESDLAGYYHTVDRILTNHDMQVFIKWLSTKPPDFYVKTKMTKCRRR